MLANERYLIIKEAIKNKGAVTISELTDMLGVSGETIRRDLLRLEKENALQRVHGGAVAASATKKFSSLSQRLSENIEQKRQLSKVAVNFIKEGNVIVIDSGSTSKEFVQIVKTRFKSLTVITPCAQVFDQLKDKDGFKLILVGGEFLPSENIFYGSLALDTIKNLHASTCFIFTSAISLKHGVADYISEAIPIQKQYIEISNKVVIMADSSKFEKTALFKLCDVNKNYHFVTSTDLNENIYKLYKSNGIKIYKSEDDFNE